MREFELVLGTKGWGGDGVEVVESSLHSKTHKQRSTIIHVGVGWRALLSFRGCRISNFFRDRFQPLSSPSQARLVFGCTQYLQTPLPLFFLARLVSPRLDSITARPARLSFRFPMRTHPSHLGAIRALAVSPSHGLLASGSDDMTIKIWSLSSLVPTSSSCVLLLYSTISPH